MANGQEIKLGVNVGQSAAHVGKTTQAVEDLGSAASAAEGELSDLASTLNEFLSARGKAAGKTPKLLNVTDDLAALSELKKQFQEVLNLVQRGDMGKSITIANGANRPKIPSQVNLGAISTSPRDQQVFMERMITRLLTHHFGTSAKPINTGLTATELLGRSIAPSPLDDHDPRHNVPGKKAPKDVGGFSQAAKHLGSQVVSAAGGGAGAVTQGGLSGVAGMLPGGLLGGAAIGAVGYGLYKGVEAVGEGIDKNKNEAVELDKFKRSLGSTAESFDVLRSQSRLIGDSFHLTYDESRKLAMDFARVARTNKGAVDQASEGVGLAQATGVDEGQGSGFMASLRHDQTIGDKKQDARILAVQFAEALRRTGSTLNASELMQTMQHFSSETSGRSLTAANMEGFAGILSAMVGSRTPGLDVKNAAGILNKADSSFQAGGAMGEASQTLQFLALNGATVGPLGVKARQTAGMFASEAQTYGGENNQLAKYLKAAGVDISKFTGKESGLEQVIGLIDKSELSAKNKLDVLNNNFGLTPQQGATLYNLHKENRLNETIGLAGEYLPPEAIQKMSSAGYTTISEIASNKSGFAGLSSIRDGLSSRKGLTNKQIGQLNEIDKITDEAGLKSALVKFSATLEREETDGEKILANSTGMANDMQLLTQGLLPAAIESRNFLAALVSKIAPDSEAAKQEIEFQRHAKNAAYAKRVDAGEVPQKTIDQLNKEFEKKYQDAMSGPEGQRGEKLRKIKAEQVELLGKAAVSPFELHGGMKESYEFFRGKGWTHEQASGLVANLKAENGSFDPAATGDNGQAVGIAQWHSDRQKDFKAKYGTEMQDATRLQQLEFMQFELTKGKYKSAGDHLRKETTQDGSATIVSREYEKPRDAYGEAARRSKIANAILDPAPVVGKTAAEQATVARPGDSATPIIFGSPGDKVVPREPPAKIPTGNPQDQSEKNANADRQRIQLDFAPIRWDASLNVAHSGGQQSTVAMSGVVSKPTASGVYA